MTFKKETEKIVSLQMKGLVHFYHPVILFERGTQYCCAAILWKGTNWKFIFLWRKINWYGLQIAKRHFSYTIWLMISEKSIMVYTFLHHGPWWCVPCTKGLSKQCIQKKLFTRISNCLKTYIHTERRNFKTFWKENCTIGLNSCYLLNFENGTEHDIDSAYGVCVH